jgi:hypothetical protein
MKFRRRRTTLKSAFVFPIAYRDRKPNGEDNIEALMQPVHDDILADLGADGWILAGRQTPIRITQIANAAERIMPSTKADFDRVDPERNDQAVRQIDEFCVSTARTERLIAVGNRGQPFDQAGRQHYVDFQERQDRRRLHRNRASDSKSYSRCGFRGDL